MARPDRLDRSGRRAVIATMQAISVEAGDDDPALTAMAETLIGTLQDRDGRLRKPANGANRRRALVSARAGHEYARRRGDRQAQSRFGEACERLGTTATDARTAATIAALDAAWADDGQRD